MKAKGEIKEGQVSSQGGQSVVEKGQTNSRSTKGKRKDRLKSKGKKIKNLKSIGNSPAA